ncbi:Alpha/beta hydrolase of unknown function [Natronoarchaeum philippinense]|uniref:Alpha/beta hydrolase n=1 Tax=Natronoarchaeum philippinense TaxID=558529 RepID=A0A285N4T7_NATPI|nr:DUF726 domain-containing protein [Natronoarchaeum philippinense]SNZ04338.1 Alpha/beta hydrolase of unknown function [Natronoarchaeum philippinense]
MKRRTFCKLAGAGAIGVASSVTSVQAAETVPLVTTRGHFDIEWGSVVRDDRYGPQEYATNGAVPGVDTGSCAPDLTVFVHGYKTKAGEAAETTSDVESSLADSGYGGTTIGYAWDADNPLWDWWETTEIARKNGPKLARFTLDYLAACPDATVRYVGYSLGAQVVLSAAQTLASWGRGETVDALTLLGAAADDQSASASGRYGPALEQVVGRVDNYWNEDDSVLNWAYGTAEFDGALGANGIEGTPPANYWDHDVSYVPDHFSYYDADEGCVDDVVANW